MKAWYRHIGISNSSDYFNWQEVPRNVELGKDRMGPDFIGTVTAWTRDEKPPHYLGQNIAYKEFTFFKS